MAAEPAPLSLFIHRASECLTDYESHGDGLICFSLLNGLAERGHQIYVYTNTALIRKCSANLHVKAAQHRVPANSVAAWEHAWRADRWLKRLARDRQIDLVWRMHPYGTGCPTVPLTEGRPLVIGPLFYPWPEPQEASSRFGVSLQGIVRPVAERGWQDTLRQATLIFCATAAHAKLTQQQYPDAEVQELPVMVDPPSGTAAQPWTGGAGSRGRKRLALVFAANLTAAKHPKIFCETVYLLRLSGIEAMGTLLGDGPERPALEAFCVAKGLAGVVCFRGKVPNGEVYSELSAADFLLSASQGEPYGRGIAEAMSVGTPAICHRSGGPADFITDGRDGLLVDTLTASAYAARLQEAIFDPSCWDRLSACATQKAKLWRMEAVLETLEQSLYRAVGQNKARLRTEKLKG